jgi:enolase
MAKIASIEANEILSSNGFPAVEATVVLNDGKIGKASCPGGDRTSHYEAADLRDGDTSRFEGQGVKKAIFNIKTLIAPPLIEKDVERQAELDKMMIEIDGTQNKSRLGANAMLAVSMAIAKAGAESSVLPLYLYLKQFIKKDRGSLKIPVPIFNLINKGNVDKRYIDFNEFLIIPASSKPYLESIQIGETIRKSLRQIIESRYSNAPDNFEDNFTPNLPTNKEGFDLIQQAIGTTDYKLGFDVFFGLNSRASAFYKDEKYTIKDNPETPLSTKELIDYYYELNKSVHLLYLEDALSQDDWDGWANLYNKLSTTTIIVGGDLIATNPYRLQMAINKKAVNAAIIKPSQIGTVIESLAIAEAARDTGLKVIVSRRTNETNDDFLSDFAVAISADYIKLGSMARGENIAKYNRLLQIDNQLKIL